MKWEAIASIRRGRVKNRRDQRATLVRRSTNIEGWHMDNTHIIGKGNPEPIYTVPAQGKMVGAAPAIVLVDPLYAKNCASVLRTCAAYGIEQLWWTGERVRLEL